MRAIPPFYAYTHARPDGSVFYIGKGMERRAWDFSPSRRSLHHQNIVRKHGREHIIVTLLPAVSEAEAFAIEQREIEKARSAGVRLINLTTGGEGCSGRVPTDAQLAALRKGRGSDRPLSDEARRNILEALARGRANVPYENRLRFVRLARAAPRAFVEKHCAKCGAVFVTTSGKARCCSKLCQQQLRRGKENEERRSRRGFLPNLLPSSNRAVTRLSMAEEAGANRGQSPVPC